MYATALVMITALSFVITSWEGMSRTMSLVVTLKATVSTYGMIKFRPGVREVLYFPSL